MTAVPAQQIAEDVRRYILENFLYTRPDFQLTDEMPLLDRGVIDSMGVLELVQFLQDQFRLEVRDEQITEENLGTVARIVAFVEREKGASRG